MEIIQNTPNLKELGLEIYLDKGKYLITAEKIIITKNLRNKNNIKFMGAALIGKLKEGKTPYELESYEDVDNKPFFVITKWMEIVTKIKRPNTDLETYYWYADVNRFEEKITIENYKMNILAFDKTHLLVAGEPINIEINYLTDLVNFFHYRILPNYDIKIINWANIKTRATICIYNKSPLQALDLCAKVLNFLWDIKENNILYIYDPKDLPKKLVLYFEKNDKCNSFDVKINKFDLGAIPHINERYLRNVDNCNGLYWINNTEYFNILNLSIYDDDDKYIDTKKIKNQKEIDRLKIDSKKDFWSGEVYKIMTMNKKLFDDGAYRDLSENYFNYFKNLPLSLYLSFKNYLPNYDGNFTFHVGHRMIIDSSFEPFNPIENEKMFKHEYLIKSIVEEINLVNDDCYNSDIKVHLDRNINQFQDINYYDEKQNINTCSGLKVLEIGNETNKHLKLKFEQIKFKMPLKVNQKDTTGTWSQQEMDLNNKAKWTMKHQSSGFDGENSYTINCTMTPYLYYIYINNSGSIILNNEMMALNNGYDFKYKWDELKFKRSAINYKLTQSDDSTPFYGNWMYIFLTKSLDDEIKVNDNFCSFFGSIKISYIGNWKINSISLFEALKKDPDIINTENDDRNNTLTVIFKFTNKILSGNDIQKIQLEINGAKIFETTQPIGYLGTNEYYTFNLVLNSYLKYDFFKLIFDKNKKFLSFNSYAHNIINYNYNGAVKQVVTDNHGLQCLNTSPMEQPVRTEGSFSNFECEASILYEYTNYGNCKIQNALTTKINKIKNTNQGCINPNT